MHRSSPVKRFCILISTSQLDNLHTIGENVDKALPQQYNRMNRPGKGWVSNPDNTIQQEIVYVSKTIKYEWNCSTIFSRYWETRYVSPFLHDVRNIRYVSLIFNLDKMLTTVKRVRVHIKYLCINIHNWIYIWCENYFHLAISAV